MSVFQSKLDIENLDFNQNLVNEIQALFLATKYNIVFLDCITNGILRQNISVTNQIMAV